MRLFFALPLPEALGSALGEWQEEAKGRELAAAFPRPDGLHLTLVFLGKVDAGRLPALSSVGEAAASGRGPFNLRTANLGCFPAHGSARVLWLGLEPSTALGELQRTLAEALRPLGFPPEPRPFSPHLTLARPKGPGGRSLWPDAPPCCSWTALELRLYESLPSSAGQRYEPRAAWSFRPLSESPPLR